jgi:tetratricopeptide (TPR) repeat protein
MRFAMLLLSLLLASLPGLGQTEPSSAGEFARRGLTCFESGDVTGAQADAQRSLELAPNNFEGLLLLGRVMTSQGEAEAALSPLGKAFEQRGQDPIVMRAYSRALFETGRKDEAVSLIESAITTHPEIAALRFHRAYYVWAGKEALSEQESQSVLGDLDRAIELDPEDYQTWGARGWVRWAFLHDDEGALQDLNQALLLRPNVKDLVTRATVYSNLGEHEKAKADLRVALTLGGDEDTMRRVREQLEISP